MQITFVYGPMTMGGIETLLVRLANMLVREGQEVELLCQDGVLANDLSSGVTVAFYRDWDDARSLFEASNQAGRQRLVVSFDPTSCALTCWLLSGANGQTSIHVTGVYHPRAWFLEFDWLRLAINRMLLRTIADDQIFFINEESRQHHATWARRDFARSAILPLGVRIHDPAPIRATDGTIRIATVGRLADFKDFNLHIPTIARQLIDYGFVVQWDVFGTGELGEQVDRAIRDTSTEHAVRLRGELPYAELGAMLAHYDIFVGMGTAAVEAATLGLPTIVAVDRGGDRTYGFIQELPFGNICEMMDNLPSSTIASLLFRLARGDTQYRLSVGTASRKAALRYSMNHYADGLLAIGAKATPGPYWLASLAGLLYREATVGRTRRLFQSLRRAVRGRRRTSATPTSE